MVEYIATKYFGDKIKIVFKSYWMNHWEKNSSLFLKHCDLLSSESENSSATKELPSRLPEAWNTHHTWKKSVIACSSCFPCYSVFFLQHLLLASVGRVRSTCCLNMAISMYFIFQKDLKLQRSVITLRKRSFWVWKTWMERYEEMKYIVKSLSL